MRKVVKLTGLLGAAALLPNISMGAPPLGIQYGNWSVNNGQFDTAASCPTGNCVVIVSGDGFLQQEVRDAGTPGGSQNLSPVYYIQTIITDPGVTGGGGAGLPPMFNESFVMVDRSAQGAAQTSNGIAARQGIVEPDGSFNSTTDIATVSFNDGTEANVAVDQLLQDPAPATGEDFVTSFNYAGMNDNTGARTGYTMEVRQLTGLYDANSAGTPSANGTGDKQAFVLQQAGGSELAAGSATIPDGPNTSSVPGTVNWNAGDEVRVTWIGQEITQPNAAAGAVFRGSTFGFQSVTNITGSDPNLNEAKWVSDIDTGPTGTWPSLAPNFTAPSYTNFTP